MACLPWWHTQFAALGGKNRVRVHSGCAYSGGNIQCAPESMRAAAQAKLKTLGHPVSLSLAEYTLARYIASEVGSGTPEEKVSVAECARNQARRRGYSDVTKLLLYVQRSGHPNRGRYGSIHGPCAQYEGKRCVKWTAPYGRWASTRQDPAVDDILIAKFVLAGKSDNFAKGADDQIGAGAVGRQSVMVNARRRDYWIGPLPGVNHQKTFQYVRLPSVDPGSAEGKALIARGLKAAESPSPDWSGLSICKKPSRFPWGTVILTGLGLAGSAYLTWRGRRG